MPLWSQTFTATEASGIARTGDWFLLVDDEDPGAYYRFPASEVRGPAYRLDANRLSRSRIPFPNHALDLEDIAVLADGRIVMLSERLRVLLDENGAIVAEYDDPLSEVGGRGLEGLAVLPIAEGGSRVAVLWEGGTFKGSDLPDAVAENLDGKHADPIVWIHDIGAHQTVGEIGVGDLVEKRGVVFNLPTPKVEPKRPFRAPALVWQRDADSTREEASFIVLLNSFKDLWIQRFDLNGKPIGRPFDFNRDADPDVKDRNWEGMAWYEEGQSLILIDDKGNKDDRKVGTPFVMIVPLPPDWK